MKRSELPLSDDDIIKIIVDNWDLDVENIQFIDHGFKFAFKVNLNNSRATFFKIYPKSSPAAQPSF